MLAACQTSGNNAPIEQRLDVTPCLKLAQTVELPPIQPGMDARAVIARYRAALVSANGNIGDTKACLATIDKAEQEGVF
ncbi:hypothetical protein [Bradyrhizobium sp. SZCCHNR3118]|uniref:hypothetical protein n=1 Tax=Bradyrhizobium sp. SZCCHNR3118 TaxID=3057468 RepID=UPI0029166F40|nr:hypothetical protein [Bradyrhizobium sp. SZCCHNR3118]